MTVVVAGALVLLSLLGLGVVRVGVAAAARARAQAAADAVALAGVVDGRVGAEQMAKANGATILSYEDSDVELEVVVAVDEAQAVARAYRLDPPPTVVVLDPSPVVLDPSPVVLDASPDSTVAESSSSTSSVLTLSTFTVSSLPSSMSVPAA